MATLESIISMITVIVTYYRRSSLEEIIILAASFLRPSTSLQRILLVQTTTIVYIIAHLFLLIITCISWFPSLTNAESSWNSFRNQKFLVLDSDATNSTNNPIEKTIKLDSTGSDLRFESDERFYESINDSKPIDDEWDDDRMMSEPFDSLTSSSESFSREVFRSSRSYPSDWEADSNNVVSNDANENEWKAPETSVKKKRQSLHSSLNESRLIFYFDFITNLICVYSLILMKSLHLSLSLLILVKCWQFHSEFSNKNHANKAIVVRRQNSDRYFNSFDKSEKERILTLAKILAKNINSYFRLTSGLLSLWITLDVLIEIITHQFYSCELVVENRFEKFVHKISTIVYIFDLTILIIVYVTLRSINNYFLDPLIKPTKDLKSNRHQ